VFCFATSYTAFRYIRIVLDDDQGWSSLNLDCIRVDAPVYRYLTVSYGSGGSTNPSSGVHQYVQGDTAYVTANPSEGYLLDYWTLDGQPAGSSNPIAVGMSANHTVHAVFREATEYYRLDVEAYWTIYDPVFPDVYIEDEYAGTAPFWTEVSEGWHTISFDDPAYDSGSYPYYFCYFNDYIYDNPASIYVTSDMYILAHYEPYQK
jgi:hypothetical protein